MDDRHTSERLNWLKKPGQPVQWFEYAGTIEFVDWDGSRQHYKKWEPITAKRAWEVAISLDKNRVAQ